MRKTADLGWLPDPSDRHRLRYRDEQGWSEWVADGSEAEREHTPRNWPAVWSVPVGVLSILSDPWFTWLTGLGLYKLFWFVPVPSAIVAIVLGARGVALAPFARGNGRVPAIIGLALGVLAAVSFVGYLVWLMYALSHLRM
jgi:hypothetical protein